MSEQIKEQIKDIVDGIHETNVLEYLLTFLVGVVDDLPYILEKRAKQGENK